MRVKRGTVSRRRHKRMQALAKGFRGRRKNVFTFVKGAVQKALRNAYHGRKRKKRDYRALWIVRINAAARQNNISYNKLICGLNRANITLDRKALAQIAVEDPQGFAALAEKARSAAA